MHVRNTRGQQYIDVGITDGINTVMKTDLSGLKIVVDENDDPNKRDKKVF